MRGRVRQAKWLILALCLALVQSSLPLFGPWPRFEARLRQELTALGFGPGATIEASVPDMIAAIRSARDLRDVHPDLADMADATARVLETFADRARTAIQANQPPPTPQTEAA